MSGLVLVEEEWSYPMMFAYYLRALHQGELEVNIDNCYQLYLLLDYLNEDRKLVNQVRDYALFETLDDDDLPDGYNDFRTNLNLKSSDFYGNLGFKVSELSFVELVSFLKRMNFTGDVYTNVFSIWLGCDDNEVSNRMLEKHIFNYDYHEFQVKDQSCFLISSCENLDVSQEKY